MKEQLKRMWFSTGFFFLLGLVQTFAQHDRAQLPKLLSHSFFSVNMGYIQYPFSGLQLEPRYEAQAVQIPHAAVRLALFGYRFKDNLSAQITYMRPVLWVRYKTINGREVNAPVFMNIGGVTVNTKFSLNEKLWVNGEAGYGLITRSGINFSDTTVLKDAATSGVLIGIGLEYKFNHKWSLGLNSVYSPPVNKVKQPYTIFFSGGFTYNLNELSADRVKENSDSRYHFPKQSLQISYSTNALGYKVNNIASEGKIPIFWGGEVEVKSGASIHYRKNVFHTRKVFSLDWGINASYYKTRINKEQFFTLSAYPVIRVTPIHTTPADVYFYYSVAGPTYISKINMDNRRTGKKFTFQDLMGLGTFIGKERRLGTEIYIGHYSNGNIFSENEGVKVPLTFNLLYTF